jgi:hypothetical protein
MFHASKTAFQSLANPFQTPLVPPLLLLLLLLLLHPVAAGAAAGAEGL